MPYVEQGRRGIYVQLDRIPETPGELNYLITSLVNAYVQEHGVCYTLYNEVLGVLTAVQFELYRRAVAPYEDAAALKNGDLPWPQKEA